MGFKIIKQYYCYVDVDGVLNSNNFAKRMLEEDDYNPFADNYLDIQAIRNLRHIVQETGAKIILSSSWRWEKESYEAIKRQLAIVGLEIYDCTDMETFRTRSRTEEILTHIRLHKDEIKNYVILDDDMILPPLSQNWVQCTFSKGLTHKLAEEAVDILKDGSLYDKRIF